MNEVNLRLKSIYGHDKGQTNPSDDSEICLFTHLIFLHVIQGPPMILCHSYLTVKGMINAEITGDKRS